MNIDNLSGRVIGQYQLRDLLGAGGMGAVYRAYQPLLNREVAIKVISSRLSNDVEFLERFRREAQTSASLQHPNIIPIYDFGSIDDISYIVMPLLRGGSLQERIKQSAETRRPRPSLVEVSYLLNQLASALDYAHNRGVIHRDIKPANVMFDTQGIAYLVDFGIAKIANATTGLTQSGVAMGTPSYMSPEQWRGEKPFPTADQYSLAVMIYQIVAGRLPFEADSQHALMYKHLNDMPTPLNVVRSDVPQAVMLVLQRALSKDPSQRFATITAFAQSFEGAIAGKYGEQTNFFTFKLQPYYQQPKPSTATPSPLLGNGVYMTPTPPQRNNTWLIVSGVVAIGLLLLGFLWVIFQNDTSANLVVTTLTAQQQTIIALSGQTSTLQPVVMIVATDTATPSNTVLPTMSFTPTPSSTPSPTSTHTDTPTGTPTATFTDTPTTTPTATLTDTPTSIPILATPDVQQIAQNTRSAILTATATVWTPTPTPDFDATINAEMTALYLQDLTMTATVWTLTPTSTITPSVTPTATATQIIFPSPTTPVTSNITANNSWEPVEQLFDGVTMVYVPAGCFTMGSDDTQLDYAMNRLGALYEWISNEQPTTSICFESGFWMDKYTVTNAQFAQLGGIIQSSNQWVGNNRPRAYITWYEARDYCLLRGGRLLTEAEWEYAARGPSNFIYPWGNEWNSNNAVWLDNSGGEPANVGSKANGASWVGAYDMSGNIWQWTITAYNDYPYSFAYDDANNDAIYRSVRGGSYRLIEYGIRPAFRGYVSPSDALSHVGFRCMLPDTTMPITQQP